MAPRTSALSERLFWRLSVIGGNMCSEGYVGGRTEIIGRCGIRGAISRIRRRSAESPPGGCNRSCIGARKRRGGDGSRGVGGRRGVAPEGARGASAGGEGSRRRGLAGRRRAVWVPARGRAEGGSRESKRRSGRQYAVKAPNPRSPALIKKTLILPLLAVAAIAAGCGSDSSTSSAGYGEPTAAATGTAAPDKPAADTQAAPAPADNDTAASDDAGGSDDAATSGAASEAAEPIAVDIADFAFAPKAIEAKVGQTITFTNKDSAPHAATASAGAKFDSGQLDQGKSFSYTAKKPGTIQFVCSFHPNMTGTITVS